MINWLINWLNEWKIRKKNNNILLDFGTFSNPSPEAQGLTEINALELVDTNLAFKRKKLLFLYRKDWPSSSYKRPDPMKKITKIEISLSKKRKNETIINLESEFRNLIHR